MKTNEVRPQVLFLNQSAGPMFMDLVSAAAESFKDISICCGRQRGFSFRGYKWLKAPRINSSTSSSKLISWILFFAVAGLKSLLLPRKSLLFIVTNPPFLPILGWVLNRVRGQKYILLFYDLYPEVLIRFAGLPNSSIIARAWKALNRLSIRRAEQIITISPALLDAIKKYTYQIKNPPNLSLISTWVDTAQIRPIVKNNNWFAVQHDQVDKLTILYSGNIGNTHDISMLVEIANRMRDIQGVHFLVISDSPARLCMEAKTRDSRLTNITFLPLQDEATFPFSSACGDIGIVALANGAEGLSMPSKTYYAMAAGSVVLALCHPISDLGEAIRLHNCGYTVSPGDADSAVRAINELKQNPALLNKYRINARAAAVRDYDKTKCVPEIIHIIKKTRDSSRK